MPYANKEIAKIKRREWEKNDRIKNPEKYKLMARKKYLANREKRLEQARTYRLNNPEKIKESNRKAKLKSKLYDPENRRRQYKLQTSEYKREQSIKGAERNKLRRKQVIEHYGNKCNCCGESIYEFLTIDHVNGGGSQHRKIISSQALPNFIIKNNYPLDFQVLCYNCNCGKSNKQLCPHKTQNLDMKGQDTMAL